MSQFDVATITIDFNRGLFARTSPSGVFISVPVSLLVTMLDGVVVCMVVRLFRVVVWNGVEVGVEVDVNVAASRSWLTWSASGMVDTSPCSLRHLDWNRHVIPLASIEPVDVLIMSTCGDVCDRFSP